MELSCYHDLARNCLLWETGGLLIRAVAGTSLWEGYISPLLSACRLPGCLRTPPPHVCLRGPAVPRDGRLWGWGARQLLKLHRCHLSPPPPFEETSIKSQDYLGDTHTQDQGAMRGAAGPRAGRGKACPASPGPPPLPRPPSGRWRRGRRAPDHPSAAGPRRGPFLPPLRAAIGGGAAGREAGRRGGAGRPQSGGRQQVAALRSVPRRSALPPRLASPPQRGPRRSQDAAGRAPSEEWGGEAGQAAGGGGRGPRRRPRTRALHGAVAEPPQPLRLLRGPGHLLPLHEQLRRGGRGYGAGGLQAGRRVSVASGVEGWGYAWGGEGAQSGGVEGGGQSVGPVSSVCVCPPTGAVGVWGGGAGSGGVAGVGRRRGGLQPAGASPDPAVGLGCKGSPGGFSVWGLCAARVARAGVLKGWCREACACGD